MNAHNDVGMYTFGCTVAGLCGYFGGPTGALGAIVGALIVCGMVFVFDRDEVRR